MIDVYTEYRLKYSHNNKRGQGVRKEHWGVEIRILFHPTLLLEQIRSQLKKFSTYPKAVTMKDPWWNGKEWVDVDGIPF
ncbi:MAG: hypothetical protein F6K21_05705 [Symploca sp. SIO2D2]|nr:hypothetical protein [Symploca sp. SIO2D2]